MTAMEQTIADLIEEHFTIEDGEDNNAFVKALLAAINKHIEVNKPKPTPVKTLVKSKTKSKSPGTGGNAYSRFFKLTSEHKKAAEGSALANALHETLVTPTPRYDPGTPSQKRYNELPALELGQVTLGNLITTIQAMIEHPMSATGVIWGLLSDNERKIIADTVYPLIV